MNKLLIISGPTASGKTSLAFELAKKFNGELISADSRQVYRGMDIVTGKEINKDVKTWLVDAVDPDQLFTVADYFQLAWSAVKDSWRRGKLPILAGGTGFYIKAVIDGVGTMGIKPDLELRRALDRLAVDELGQRLQNVDPKRWERMNVSDRKNPRRLIRAIEVTMVSGHPEFISGSRGIPKPFNEIQGKQVRNDNKDVLWIGLTASNRVLYQRIDQRVDERVKSGAVKETRQLAKKYGWDIPSMTGQGYRELRDYIEGKISFEEAAKRWKFSEHEYARKQMTWFKKEKRIVWFDITTQNFVRQIEQKAKEWCYN